MTKPNFHVCPTCDGYGDHGLEEETGMPYICYACGGTGYVDEVEDPRWSEPTADDFADADAVAYGAM